MPAPQLYAGKSESPVMSSPDSQIHPVEAIHDISSTFDRGDTNATLLTSDEVNLRINKWPLIRVSQIFEDLFTVPQPDNSLEEPVVQIAETAETMINLLKFLYLDWDDPQITTVYTMRNLLAATDKYDILRIRRLLIEIACSDAFVNQFPVDCYTLALRYNSSRLKQISLHVLKGINLIGNQDINRVLRDAYLFGIEYFDLLVAHGHHVFQPAANYGHNRRY